MNAFLCFIVLTWHVQSHWKTHSKLYPFMSLLSLYRLCYAVYVYLYNFEHGSAKGLRHASIKKTAIPGHKQETLLGIVCL